MPHYYKEGKEVAFYKQNDKNCVPYGILLMTKARSNRRAAEHMRESNMQRRLRLHLLETL